MSNTRIHSSLKVALPTLILCALPWFAQAHSPFLVPTSFEPLHEGWVSLDAGFSEIFFVPEVAFDKGNFQVLTPAGNWVAPKLQQLKTRSVVEFQTQDEGTYRFTTGVRKAAIFRMYELNGERKHTRDPKEVLPKEAKLLDHFQSVTLAETFVTLKKPTKAALKPHKKGLEVLPLTHPNDVYAGEAFEFQLLLDGKPLSGNEISLFTGYDGNEHEKPTLTTTTDSNGKAKFTIADAGTYLLYARKSAPAPQGAEAPNYGYVYTLSFAVNAAL
jgi:uncharacterized GH25 family protein